MKPDEAVRTGALLVITVLLAMAAMYLLADVLVPFVLAAFGAMLLNPLVDQLVRRFRWPRPLAVAGTFAAGALLLAAAAVALVPPLAGAVDHVVVYARSLDETARNAVDALPDDLVDESTRDSLKQRLGVAADAEVLTVADAVDALPNELADDDAKASIRTRLALADDGSVVTAIAAVDELPDDLADDAAKAVLRDRLVRLDEGDTSGSGSVLLGKLLPYVGLAGGGALSLLGDAGLILVFLLFLLLGRGDRPVAQSSARHQLERRIQAYLAVTLTVSAATGLLVGLSLWLIGVELAWVFGAAAFVLNFIPVVGSAFATLLPLPFILFGQDLSTPVIIAAVIVPAAIQFALGNVVAPKLLGDALQLSPVAVMLGLIVLGAIWGLAGMVLSTPILSVLKIAIERLAPAVPMLRRVSAALEGGPTKPAVA